MKTSMQVVSGLGKRFFPLLVMIVVGAMTMAWQPQLDQTICDPATGQNCATPAKASKHNRPTRTPVPTATPSPTATSTATATSTVTETASPAPTASETSPAPLGQPAPVPPPANPAPGQPGPAWPLIGGGALLVTLVGLLLYYLVFRRRLNLLPAIQDVSPGARETGTVVIRDEDLENFTISAHDGLGSVTVTFQDPGGSEDTLGGKDINNLSGSGMS